jgi:centromere/kinetochore protein ZW10
MGLPEALVALKALNEVEQRMAVMWHSLDEAIVAPRTSLESDELPGLASVGVGWFKPGVWHPD